MPPMPPMSGMPPPAAASSGSSATRHSVVSSSAAIEAAFGDWKEGLPPVTDVPSPVTGRAVHVVDRPGAPQSTIAVGLPTIDPSQEDFVALQVTNALLGGSFASRITANIREDKGYTYGARSLFRRWRDAGYFGLFADVQTKITGS